MRAVLPVLAAVVVVCGAACARAPEPAPTPSQVPLREVATCAATVVVPDLTATAVASASTPPTVVLRVGDSVTFDVPAGARVGLAGEASPEEEATVCAAPDQSAGSRVYVATQPGFLRIGIQTGVDPVARVLLQVTG